MTERELPYQGSSDRHDDVARVRRRSGEERREKRELHTRILNAIDLTNDQNLAVLWVSDKYPQPTLSITGKARFPRML